jgi:putative transposase
VTATWRGQMVEGAVHPINWKTKYGGTGASDLKRLEELEAENAKLKKMYADLALENEAIRSVLNRKP